MPHGVLQQQQLGAADGGGMMRSASPSMQGPQTLGGGHWGSSQHEGMLPVHLHQQQYDAYATHAAPGAGAGVIGAGSVYEGQWS